MVFLMEAKLDSRRMEFFRKRCRYGNGIKVDAEGSHGGLCFAWVDDLTVELRSFSKGHIDVIVLESNGIGCWRFVGFYGPPVANTRISSWDLLRRLGHVNNLL